MISIFTAFIVIFLIVEANKPNPDPDVMLSLAISASAGLIAMGIERFAPKRDRSRRDAPPEMRNESD